jgi:hypothetical protein
MGLDSYIEDDSGNEVHYWRKHHSLNAWIVRLGTEKGVVVEDCPLPLSISDLESLRLFIESQSNEDWCRWGFNSDKTDDLNVISHVISLIQSGKAIWYRASW